MGSLSRGYGNNLACGHNLKIADNAFVFDNVFRFDNADNALAFDNLDSVIKGYKEKSACNCPGIVLCVPSKFIPDSGCNCIKYSNPSSICIVQSRQQQLLYYSNCCCTIYRTFSKNLA